MMDKTKMTDNVTYSFPLGTEFPDLPKSCETCKWWNRTNEYDNYCNKIRLTTANKISLKGVNLLYTYRSFCCKYYEPKEV